MSVLLVVFFRSAFGRGISFTMTRMWAIEMERGKKTAVTLGGGFLLRHRSPK